MGNITTLIDHAQETVYQNNTRIEPKHAYVYDALYRLVQATGRENAAAQGPPPTDEGPWPSGSFPSATSVRGYTQTYRYDAVGNFQTMKHVPTQGRGWTRHYAYAFEDPGQPASNRLWRTWKNGPVWDGTGADSVTYRYDSHGSMLNLNRVEVPPPQAENWGHQIVWDWRDMIRRFDAIGGGMARYHYGIDKQRTRKHINGIGGGEVKDRLYFGGFELYRRRNSSGTVVEEIETHHLFEGEQRVLLVDDVIDTDRTHRNTNIPYRTQPILRYQYSNHLGSVGLELDDTARVISYEEFHPYGTSAYRLMNSAVEAPPKRYRYTGMERDEESGLHYNSARYYNPAISQWVSSDPSGISGGLCLYTYCAVNPITNRDETGLQPEKFTNRSLEGETLPGGVREQVAQAPIGIEMPQTPSPIKLPLLPPTLQIIVPPSYPTVSVARGPIEPRVSTASYKAELEQWAKDEGRTPLEKLADAFRESAENDPIRWIAERAPIPAAPGPRRQFESRSPGHNSNNRRSQKPKEPKQSKQHEGQKPPAGASLPRFEPELPPASISTPYAEAGSKTASTLSEKIAKTRTFFDLPPSARTTVGLFNAPGLKKPLEVTSGKIGGPWIGSHKGGIPRGLGNRFAVNPTEKNLATHVEGHAVAGMWQLNVRVGYLLVGGEPCGVCAPNIAGALPPGATLVVIHPDAMNPGAWTKTVYISSN